MTADLAVLQHVKTAKVFLSGGFMLF